MICWQRVDELRTEIGEDDFHEVVQLFLEEVEEALERLFASADPEAVAADLHFLKGSAFNLGFETLGTFCSDGETRAAARQLDPGALARVRETYEASKTEFLARVRVDA